MTEQVREKRDIPLWLGIALIVVGVTGAGLFIWSQVSGFWSGPSGVFTIEGVPSGQAYPRMGRPPQPPSFVRAINDTNWRVRVGASVLNVRKQDTNLNMTLQVFSQRTLPEDSKWLVMARGRLNPTSIKEMKLTPDQVKMIRTLPTSPNIAASLDPAELQTMQEVFSRYLAANDQQKPAIDREIGQKLGQIAQKALPRVEADVKNKYNTLKSSLTPDQWEQLKASATARPATTPAA